ncbi:MAG: hypothetical protein J6K26_08085, partial [Lachnospiraceae bacterium]|nr:hypothetical protein [Lachnospiraceae bacterium]
ICRHTAKAVHEQEAKRIANAAWTAAFAKWLTAVSFFDLSEKCSFVIIIRQKKCKTIFDIRQKKCLIKGKST